jgi:polar amino acid transport system substrate-binding protein
MKKFISIKLVALLLLTLTLLIGCSNNEPATSKTPEENKTTYVMGLDDTFAPMGFRDEKGQLIGFDIDLANEVSKRLGITIEFQPIDWSMKETELNAGNIDFIWNGYTITAERQEKVAFSKPYLENSQIIVVLANSDVSKKADLAGKNVAVQAESSALDAINAEPEFVKSINELVEFSTNNEAFMDLEAGRSNALVVDEVLARFYMRQNGQDKFKVLEEDFGNEEYGIGLRKDDSELLKKLDEALDEMKKDGTYDEIYAKWFSEN